MINDTEFEPGTLVWRVDKLTRDQMIQDEGWHSNVVPADGGWRVTVTHEPTKLTKTKVHHWSLPQTMQLAEDSLFNDYVVLQEADVIRDNSLLHEMVRPLSFDEWFAMQHELQRHFEMDPDEYEGEELANYVRWNCLALIDELMEFLAEWRWKPWDREDKRGTFEDREALVSEFADMLHFVANLALAAKITPDEAAKAYEEKVSINKRRKDNNYDARVKDITARDRDREAERKAAANASNAKWDAFHGKGSS